MSNTFKGIIMEAGSIFPQSEGAAGVVIQTRPDHLMKLQQLQLYREIDITLGGDACCQHEAMFAALKKERDEILADREAAIIRMQGLDERLNGLEREAKQAIENANKRDEKWKSGIEEVFKTKFEWSPEANGKDLGIFAYKLRKALEPFHAAVDKYKGRAGDCELTQPTAECHLNVSELRALGEIYDRISGPMPK